jgi:hypothetical protein
MAALVIMVTFVPMIISGIPSHPGNFDVTGAVAKVESQILSRMPEFDL